MSDNRERHSYDTFAAVSTSLVTITQVKIASNNKEMLHSACQQFMDKDYHEIMHIATETLEGHQRAIMGNMTIEVAGM